MENEFDPQKEFRVITIVAGAMVASLFIYAGIAEFMKHSHNPFTGFAPQVLPQVKDFYLASVLLVFVAIRKVRSYLLKKEKNDNPKSLFSKLRIATVVTFALAEIPTILGMALFLLGGMDKELYTLLVCSGVIMCIYFPRYRHWEAFMERTSSFY